MYFNNNAGDAQGLDQRLEKKPVTLIRLLYTHGSKWVISWWSKDVDNVREAYEVEVPISQQVRLVIRTKCEFWPFRLCSDCNLSTRFTHYFDSYQDIERKGREKRVMLLLQSLLASFSLFLCIIHFFENKILLLLLFCSQWKLSGMIHYYKMTTDIIRVAVFISLFMFIEIKEQQSLL